VSADLPARPSLEHLRKQAKSLLAQYEQQLPDALRRFSGLAHPPRSGDAKLADAQHVIAREHGFETWAALKAHVEAAAPPVDPMEALAAVVRTNDVVQVGRVLQQHRELRSRLDEAIPGGAFGATALLTAVHRGNKEMVDLLLREGANINGRSHWWAGSFGVLDGDHALVPYLIERGAHVDAYAAARLGMLDRLRGLVNENAALVHMRGGDGQTPLHVAANLEIARFLVDHGAEIDARDVDHESTPAQYMVRDRQEIARYLVGLGARTDILMSAALGDLERVRGHLDADPASIRTEVSEEFFPKIDRRAGGTIYIWTLGAHKTAHVIAREFGHEDVFRFLMERSPAELKLALASELGDEALLHSLLEREPDLVHRLPESDRRRFVNAAQDNNLAAVRLMLSVGWPLDARGQHGATALHWAAFHGNAEMAREILRYGPPLELADRDFNGRPLGWAIHASLHGWHPEAGDYAGVVRALLDAGAMAPEVDDSLRASEAVMKELAGRQEGRR
jgi:ankyrin repeat protein